MDTEKIESSDSDLSQSVEDRECVFCGSQDVVIYNDRDECPDCGYVYS